VLVAPMGAPLAIALRAVMMSGVTSQCSIPTTFARAPETGLTSSEINRPPYFFTALKTILKYSGAV